jgi:hypothetical protein
MPKKTILLCKHCGNEAPHKLKYTHPYTEVIYIDDGEQHHMDAWYYVVVCETCNEVSLYGDWELSDNPGDLTQATLLYPEKKDLPDIVPATVQRTYKEASRIAKLAPSAYAVQIRKALECICTEHKLTKGTLEDRLTKLSESGVIPPKIAQLADAIRLLGNIGAHDDSAAVTKDDVRYLDDFFRAVIEYVYIGPDKLEKLSKSLKERKGKRN